MSHPVVDRDTKFGHLFADAIDARGIPAAWVLGSRFIEAAQTLEVVVGLHNLLDWDTRHAVLRVAADFEDDYAVDARCFFEAVDDSMDSLKF